MRRRLMVRMVAFAAGIAAVLGTTVAASARDAGSDRPDSPSASVTANLVPGAAWSDQNGTLAQLHGVGILKDGRTYYAYGEDKSNGGTYTAVACYSSTDLVSWTRHTDALSRQDSGDLGPNRVIERPKVIRNPRTGQYVMYMHVDSSDYGDARVGVATSSTPCGPYTYRGSVRPLDQQSRDIGLFQDTDGTGYLLTEDRANGLRIDRLSADYLTVQSSVAVLADLEAPAMVKVGGTYYLFASHLTGWGTNDNVYATASSLAGPWSAWKPFAPTGSQTFNSQTSFILPVTGRHGTSYVYVGDRWYSSHLYDSAPIWLPMTIGAGSASMTWQRAWSIDVAAGTWRPQRTYATYEVDSDAVLADGARVVACAACTGNAAVGQLGLPSASPFTYDDFDPALKYTGAWTPATNQDWSQEDYDQTETYSTAAGDSVSVAFTGTQARWIGPKNTNGGIAEVYLDGAKVATVDTYTSGDKAFQQVLYSTSGLAAGEHTLTIKVTGQKNPASSADTVVVDAIDLPGSSQTAKAGSVQTGGITVDRSGDYTVQISYANPDAANRYAYLSVNGARPVKLAFPTTGGTTAVNTAVARVHLKAGGRGNTVRFTNPNGPAPLIDTVTVPVPQASGS